MRVAVGIYHSGGQLAVKTYIKYMVPGMGRDQPHISNRRVIRSSQLTVSHEDIDE